jgi:hypothetical protein
LVFWLILGGEVLWQAVDTVASRSIRWNLLTFLWCVAALGCVIAGVALMKAWLTAKRFNRLAESYWELRYEHGQLASRLGRLETQSGLDRGSPEQVAARTGASFVPLSSLKR